MDTVGLCGSATYHGLSSPNESGSESELPIKNNGSQLVKIQAVCSGFIRITNKEKVVNKRNTPHRDRIDESYESHATVVDFDEVSEDEEGTPLSLLHLENQNENQFTIFNDKKRKHKRERRSVKKLKSTDGSSVDLHSTSSSDSFNGKTLSDNETQGEDDSSVISLTTVVNLSVDETQNEEDCGSKMGEVLPSREGDEPVRINQNSKLESSPRPHPIPLIYEGGTEFYKTGNTQPTSMASVSEQTPNSLVYSLMEPNARCIDELDKMEDGMLPNHTANITTESDCPESIPISQRGYKIKKQMSFGVHSYSIQVPTSKSGVKDNGEDRLSQLSLKHNDLRIKDHEIVEGNTNTECTLPPITNVHINIRKFLSHTIEISSPNLDVAAAIMLGTLFAKKIENKMSLDDINEALIQGKPEPPNINNRTHSPEGREELSKQVNEISNKSWLTGSRQLQCYLCWDCLLFARAVWCLPTETQLDSILKAVEAHQSEWHHMEAGLKLQFYEANISRDQEAQLKSKKKCEILLRYLIQIVCSHGAAEERLDLLSLACTYNTELEQFVREQPDNFLRDFVDTNITLISPPVERFLLSEIKNEIQSAPFVSIIFEEITDGRSFVAIILRYVNNSNDATERLVKMVRIGTHSVTDFLKTMNQVVQDYHLSEKLVGYTYSGSIIHPKDILIVNTTINRLYPTANFFPYQEHNFRKIITQSLLHLPECRKFISTMSELADFFKNSPKILAQLQHIDEEAMNVNDKWDFAYDHITTIKNHYKSIMFFFDEIVSSINWEPEIVTQVRYFERFLGSSDCRVLVLIVSAVLSAISALCTVTESKIEIDCWKKALDDATGNLSMLKITGVGKLLQDNRTTLPGGIGIESSKTSLLYDEIIDTTLMVINQRCVNLDMASVGPRFIRSASKCDEGTLTGLLKHIRVDHDTFTKIIQRTKSYFGEHLNLEEVIKQIHNLEMDNSDKQILHNCLQLSLTIPTKPANPSTPAIHRLHSYVTKNKTVKFPDLLIYMENDICNSVKNEEKFFDYIKDSMH